MLFGGVLKTLPTASCDDGDGDTPRCAHPDGADRRGRRSRVVCARANIEGFKIGAISLIVGGALSREETLLLSHAAGNVRGCVAKPSLARGEADQTLDRMYDRPVDREGLARKIVPVQLEIQ